MATSQTDFSCPSFDVENSFELRGRNARSTDRSHRLRRIPTSPIDEVPFGWHAVGRRGVSNGFTYPPAAPIFSINSELYRVHRNFSRRLGLVDRRDFYGAVRCKMTCILIMKAKIAQFFVGRINAVMMLSHIPKVLCHNATSSGQNVWVLFDFRSETLEPIAHNVEGRCLRCIPRRCSGPAPDREGRDC